MLKRGDVMAQPVIMRIFSDYV